MADWRPFGYKGKPGTCIWCGRPLVYRRVMADESDKGNPTYREEGSSWATVRDAEPGGYGDGLFCGLRCGYRWAVRAAGRRTDLVSAQSPGNS